MTEVSFYQLLKRKNVPTINHKFRMQDFKTNVSVVRIAIITLQSASKRRETKKKPAAHRPPTQKPPTSPGQRNEPTSEKETMQLAAQNGRKRKTRNAALHAHVGGGGAHRMSLNCGRGAVQGCSRASLEPRHARD